MEEKMNYTFMPSLKHRALVKITAALWNQSDIRDLVAGCAILYDPFTYRVTVKGNAWQVIEDKVTGRVPNLPLPESLKKEVLDLAQRMGVEARKWKEYHHRYICGDNLCTDESTPAELCWTPQGIVDKQKTAEVLVKDESIDITTRYKLACIYCLEDHVKKLWNSVPQRQKEYIYEGGKYFSGISLLIRLWTYEITREITKFSDLIREIAESKRIEASPYQFQFEYSARYANKAAAGYFLQKLTPGERDESLVMCATDLAKIYLFISRLGDYKNEDFEISEIMCFLLSEMTVEQQVEVFKRSPAGVLSCLLHWPWEIFFVETSNCVWGFLSEEDFELLLKAMIARIRNGFKNCNYHTLFGEFWEQSPNTYKKYVCGGLTTHSRRFLLSDLLQIEDKQNISLIFKNVTMEEREKIIFSDTGMDICSSLIFENKWSVLKFFVQECISSYDRIEQLLRQIISHFPEGSAYSKNDLLMRFSSLLFFDYFKKRGMEEEDSNPAKKLKPN